MPKRRAPSILKRPHADIIGRSILYYPVLPSTMDMAKKMAKEGMDEGAVIIAGEQTEGRGRLGRKWVAPPDSSLSLSIILRPDMNQLPQLNMMASLAVVQSIQNVTGLRPLIKWPNDVLLNGKKVSGILIENVFEGAELRAAIVGIGININLDPSSFPEIASIATSLSIEAHRDVSPHAVLTSFLDAFEELYKELREGGNVYKKWLPFVETVGKTVRVKSGEAIEEGYVESIDANGSLILRKSDGRRLTMIAGEVTLHI